MTTSLKFSANGNLNALTFGSFKVVKSKTKVLVAEPIMLMILNRRTIHLLN